MFLWNFQNSCLLNLLIVRSRQTKIFKSSEFEWKDIIHPIIRKSPFVQFSGRRKINQEYFWSKIANIQISKNPTSLRFIFFQITSSGLIMYQRQKLLTQTFFTGNWKFYFSEASRQDTAFCWIDRLSAYLRSSSFLVQPTTDCINQYATDVASGRGRLSFPSFVNHCNFAIIEASSYWLLLDRHLFRENLKAGFENWTVQPTVFQYFDLALTKT